MIVSAVLFIAVWLLEWSVATVADAVCVLYVLPVALLAMSFGLRVGLAAGIVATLLSGASIVAGGETLDALGWVSRLTPLLLIGVLVGLATERIRAADRMERTALELAVLEREAAEINDTVLQQMAAAKWMLESGRLDDGLKLLEAAMTTTEQLVSSALGSQSVIAGDLRRSLPGVQNPSDLDSFARRVLNT